jgi:hypothetical protein
MGTDRRPTKQEKQTAAAALQALNDGDVEKALLLDRLLEMTQEDNDNSNEGQ